MTAPDVATFSEIGARHTNQDVLGWRIDGAGLCCVVCDGAGGHRGGQRAASIGVATVLDAFDGQRSHDPTHLLELIDLANARIVETQQLEPAVYDMRSTIVVLTCHIERLLAVWGHAGDTRLYFFRNGCLVSRTEDHTLLQALIDSRLAGEEELRRTTSRSVLTNALGGEDPPSMDLLDEPLALQPGDAVLICTDGFWEVVDDMDMEETLQRADSCVDWLGALRALIDQAPCPPDDNYSAAALMFGRLDPATRLRPANR